MAQTLTLDQILTVLQEQGTARYGQESVSQLQHALQCATLATQAGTSAELVAAALLHDFGHLVHDLGEDAADRGIDDRHEYRALGFLKPLFGEAVTEPIRLHVDAKRYLCATDQAYWESLSPASQQSLELQGGIYSPAEAQAFIQQPFAEDAVKLRCWDDRAKVPDLPTPALGDFRDSLLQAQDRK
jgi:phosphonate degradation associated HDIG domain protein